MPGTAGSLTRRQLTRALLLGVGCYILPALWVALTPPLVAPARPGPRTRQALAVDNQALHAFLERAKKTPRDLCELRAFARAERLPFEAYDAFGERFDYLRLDDEHYLLRSFGEDQIQNTPFTAPDMGIVHWGPRPAKSFTYRYADTPDPDLYPAALLPGADSPDGAWLARLFVDPENQTRQLVVRHRAKTGLFMVARHDAVEEFLWLPTSHQIVFTASGSSRHRDGLYLWNLNDDTLVNLADAAAKSLPMSPAQGGVNLWLSLAGISRQGPTVYAWHHLRHDGSLDPAEFFTRRQLLAFVIPERSDQEIQLVPPSALGPAADASPFARPLALGARVAATGGLKLQQEWLKLAVDGDIEQVLLEWHQFSERAGSSPLSPYTLWVLHALYGESFAALASTSGHDADVVRTFGTEIAAALLNDPLAPTYLKGLALHSYTNLMEGEGLPYRFARLTPKDAHDHRSQ